MRDVAEFAIVSEGVGLNASEVLLLESKRKRDFTQQQLVRPIDVFDSRPGKVVRHELQCRFGQIAIANVAVREALECRPTAPVFGIGSWT